MFRSDLLLTYTALPDIGLYMDQVLDFLNIELAKINLPADEGNLTASMINNYVKFGLVERPEKKRYQREQLAQLLIITAAKSILSLQEIKALFVLLQSKNIPMPPVYDAICRQLHEAHGTDLLGPSQSESGFDRETFDLLTEMTSAFIARQKAKQHLLELSAGLEVRLEARRDPDLHPSAKSERHPAKVEKKAKAGKKRQDKATN